MATCSARCKNEFRLKNFLFHHDDAQTFVQFQFGAQAAYLAWRLFWTVYHVIWIILTGVYSYQFAGPDPAQQVKWFIYLTDWAYLTLTLAAIIDFVVVLYVFFKRKDIRKGFSTDMTWYMKLNWCVVTTSNDVAVTLTLAYWTLIYTGYTITAIDIATHALNSLYVITNLMLTGMPTRLFHAWLMVAYGLIYVFFSLFYYLAGGLNNKEKPYIYSVLDWREAGTTVAYCIGVIVIGLVVHIILFGLYSLKVYISEMCCNRNEESKESKIEGGHVNTELSVSYNSVT